MKLIHTADIHLGAKADSVYPKDAAEKIKLELRRSLLRLVSFAKENGVNALLLAGDVFDSDHPFLKDKKFFLELVQNNPEITFFYLRGNHDADGTVEEFENLKTFGNETKTYFLAENITVSGVELTPQNADAAVLSLNLPAEKKNVLLLHGSKDEVRFSTLRRKNIDYLALGHIHKPEWGKLDDRGFFGYCGCLQGRGFDEIGERGFLLLDTETGFEPEFIPFSELQIKEISVDVSGVDGSYAAYGKVKEQISFEKRHIYRINLIGETESEETNMASDVANYLSDSCLFAQVKDRTVRKFDIARYTAGNSLLSEFAKLVNESKYEETEKAEILSLGARALAGKDLE